MIVNRIPDSLRTTKLLAAGTLTVLLLAAPSLAAASPTAGTTAVAAQLQLAAKQAPDVANTEETPKPAKKAEEIPPPELPALPHVIAQLAPNHWLGKWMHHSMYIIRPVFGLFVISVMLLLFGAGYRRRQLRPGRLQTLLELLVEAMDNLVCGVLGPKNGRRYLPYLGALFIYIVCLNMMGMVPLFLSPTNFIATTGALAICTFCVVQYTAITKLGIKGMVNHWAGEPKDVVGYCVAVLLIPLHLVEELIKPLSLALRLFGNIFGEDVLLGSMLMLGVMVLAWLPNHGIPVGLPLELPFMFLSLLLGTIQALVFTLLSSIYILMVLPHDDHEHEEHAESHA
ncbi:MAG: F0F1 ATP synthase subunit A [bacterium]